MGSELGCREHDLVAELYKALMLQIDDGKDRREASEDVLTSLDKSPPSLVCEVFVSRESGQGFGSPGIDGLVLCQMLATSLNRCTLANI